jgi:nitrate/nitrite transport system permease protein
MMERKAFYSPSFALFALGRWLKQGVLPLLGMGVFVLFWHIASVQIKTPLGALPSPVQTVQQFIQLIDEHQLDQKKEAAFFARQAQRHKEKLAINPNAETHLRGYTGQPTFVDQILTSLITVFCGFIVASLIAVPLGLLFGLYPKLYFSFNPLIQLLKPISPLAWLPIITMIVSACYVSDDPWVSKSFMTSMLTVSLCCLWPTLINTVVGVTSVDKDLLNVSRVLRLSNLKHIRTIIFPSALPMIFTGLRLSLGIAWMVLIAAEMLAQSPGLGKFVWDEFQSGSRASLERIMVAVVVIGFIGLLLDRGMRFLQTRLSWDKKQVIQ